MKTKLFAGAAALIVAATVTTVPVAAQERIQIVGSSTVFPFATAVAEQFGQKTNFPTPVVESTGSGGGMKLFCAGVGNDTPDITNASRRIKSSEFEACTENGITVTEVKIGFDGIVLAQDKGAPDVKLTTRQIYLALAKQVPVDGKLVDNPYRKWSDIDPSLPNEKIEVLGPPPTSGTRDAFVELAMESGAKEFPVLKELRDLKAGDPRVAEIAKGLGLTEGAYMKDGATVKGKNLFRAIAHTLREDGAFVEAGENDNLIVQKLEANPGAVGIFGFSFLDQNADALKGATVNDVEPTFENIASGDYDISRSLYFYVKGEHVGVVPGIKEYIAEFTSEAAWGEDGYLVDKGLIPLTDEERKTVGEAARNLTAMSM